MSPKSQRLTEADVFLIEGLFWCLSWFILWSFREWDSALLSLSPLLDPQHWLRKDNAGLLPRTFQWARPGSHMCYLHLVSWPFLAAREARNFNPLVFIEERIPNFSQHLRLLEWVTWSCCREVYLRTHVLFFHIHKGFLGWYSISSAIQRKTKKTLLLVASLISIKRLTKATSRQNKGFIGLPI